MWRLGLVATVPGALSSKRKSLRLRESASETPQGPSGPHEAGLAQPTAAGSGSRHASSTGSTTRWWPSSTSLKNLRPSSTSTDVSPKSSASAVKTSTSARRAWDRQNLQRERGPSVEVEGQRRREGVALRGLSAGARARSRLRLAPAGAITGGGTAPLRAALSMTSRR